MGTHYVTPNAIIITQYYFTYMIFCYEVTVTCINVHDITLCIT